MLPESKFTIKTSALTDGSLVYAVVGYDQYGTTQISVDCTSRDDAEKLADLLNDQFGIALEYVGNARVQHF